MDRIDLVNSRRSRRMDHPRRNSAWRVPSLAMGAILAITACTSGISPAPSAAGGGASPAAASAAAATKHVSIVNKDMTDDEIKAAIAAEGSVIVGNWTYTANDELVKQFEKYVKDTYGADVKLTY